MTASREPDLSVSEQREDGRDDAETLLTSPEDVASAGRSCMAIVVLGALTLLLLLVWLGFRALGGQ